MKVGIITFHNAVNYGAAFQAYATQQALINLGVEAEIIDYLNEHRQEAYSLMHLIRRAIRKRQFLYAIKATAGYPLIKIRKDKFIDFYNKKSRLSSKKYLSGEELKNDPPVYDYYLAGSDQIWHYEHNGEDMNFLLDFVKDKSRTVSYASSFGLSEIPEKFRKEYSQLLSQIHSLAVREQTGAKLVKSLTGRDVPVVLDPVFLLDKQQWSEIAVDYKGIKEPYILLYTTKTKYYQDFLQTSGYDTSNLALANLTTSTRIKDVLDPKTKIVFAASPEEFLGLLKNAKLVLTSSFHGTVLSIIFQKQFVSFLAGDMGKDARIIDMLESFGLSGRIFCKNMSADVVDSAIDFKPVQLKLNKLREDSINYLKQAINL